MTRNTERLSMNSMDELPVFPEGWYFVTSRASILREKLIEKTWLGEEIVAWCEEAGRVCVADAVCPHPHAGSQVVRLRSQPLGGGGARVVAIAPPEVKFVGDVKTQAVGRQADPVGELDAKIAVYVGTHPQFVQVGGDTRIGGGIRVGDTKRRLKQRKRRGFDDTLPRPGLVDPGDRLGQVEVRGQHRFDYLVENRVGERLPPLQRLV